jgi:conjugal transfer pilus assembly protein TraV
VRRLLPVMLFFLASCNTYKQSFDSCPGRGVPCTSVSDIESMVVETTKGPDVFLPNENRTKRPVSSRTSAFESRILILDNPQDLCGDGHYIYLSEDFCD